ncbi:TetR/AcrR family transcriptional regulator [Kytococcus sp. Marseille-QA3725]
MPRLADHAARRAALADAVFALIAREGLPSASVRGVAAEVGWSPGAVRHYFSAQHDLLTFVMQEMDARIGARVRALRSEQGAGRDRALATLEQLLPLDEERRREVATYLAFVVAGATDDRLAAAATEAWKGERWLVRAALADVLGVDVPAGPDHVLPADAEAKVPGLHAVVDGLTLAGQAVPGEVDADVVRSVLREALASACSDLVP